MPKKTKKVKVNPEARPNLTPKAWKEIRRSGGPEADAADHAWVEEQLYRTKKDERISQILDTIDSLMWYSFQHEGDSVPKLVQELRTLLGIP